MKTKFITEIASRINPFSPCAKPARLFLTQLPSNARSTGINISTKLLPPGSKDPSSLRIKFKDGNEMKFDCDQYTLKVVMELVERHSRTLQKKSDLED